MIKKRSILYKTFGFTLILITVILTVTFSILYFTLPAYYTYSKSKTINENTNKLAEELAGVEDENKYIEIASKYVEENNTTLISFDKDESVLPNLSSPFISLENETGTKMKYQIIFNESDPSIIAKTGTAETWQDTENSVFFTTISIARDTGGAIVIKKQLQSNLVEQFEIFGSMQPIDEAKDVMVALIPYLFLVDLIIATIGSYIYSKQLTRPLLKISQATNQMQHMVEGAASNVRTNDELGVLSQNVDALYNSLCENISILKKEITKVNRLEQSKADFMRSASHELKTPIAVLNGLLEGMIDNIGVYKNRDKYLVESKNTAENISDMVSQILSVSSMSDINETVQYDNVAMRELIHSTLDNYKILIDDKNIGVTLTLTEFNFKSDIKMVSHIFSNLISNAVNYTAKGGNIIISLNSDTGLFTIENECKPVDESLLEKLYEPFYTLESSHDKSLSGSGLGLYIVKSYLDILNIRHTVQNTQTGLKFTIYFKNSTEM